MKKSNKLLLGGFLTLLLMIAGIQVGLYAKYKKGDYTLYREEEDHSLQSYQGISEVRIENVPGGIVRFGDVARTENGEQQYIQYTRSGNTLFISWKDTASRDGLGDYLAFYIPYNTTLVATNSSLTIEQEDKAADNSPVIHLRRSHLLFSGTEAPLRFNQLKLVASDNSDALFRGNVQVNDLDISLSNSSVEHQSGGIGRLSIETDSLSRISFQAQHLLKARMVSMVPK